MMRAGGRTADGRPLIALGLERGNFERLERGMPIYFDMAPLGIVGQCLIIFGETAEDCARQFTALTDMVGEGSA